MIPPGKEIVVIAGFAEITMLRSLVSFPALLDALAVKLNVPAVVGVPVIAPLDVFRFKPVGSEPLLIAQVIGVVPVAVRVRL